MGGKAMARLCMCLCVVFFKASGRFCYQQQQIFCLSYSHSLAILLIVVPASSAGHRHIHRVSQLSSVEYILSKHYRRTQQL